MLVLVLPVYLLALAVGGIICLSFDTDKSLGGMVKTVAVLSGYAMLGAFGAIVHRQGRHFVTLLCVLLLIAATYLGCLVIEPYYAIAALGVFAINAVKGHLLAVHEEAAWPPRRVVIAERAVTIVTAIELVAVLLVIFM